MSFGGRIALDGFSIGSLSLTASGTRMNLRYPEGFPRVVNADLELTGTLSAATLSGNVQVLDAWSRDFDTTPNLFNFGGGSSTTFVGGGRCRRFR